MMNNTKRKYKTIIMFMIITLIVANSINEITETTSQLNIETKNTTNMDTDITKVNETSDIYDNYPIVEKKPIRARTPIKPMQTTNWHIAQLEYRVPIIVDTPIRYTYDQVKNNLPVKIHLNFTDTHLPKPHINTTVLIDDSTGKLALCQIDNYTLTADGQHYLEFDLWILVELDVIYYTYSSDPTTMQQKTFPRKYYLYFSDKNKTNELSKIKGELNLNLLGLNFTMWLPEYISWTQTKTVNVTELKANGKIPQTVNSTTYIKLLEIKPLIGNVTLALSEIDSDSEPEEKFIITLLNSKLSSYNYILEFLKYELYISALTLQLPNNTDPTLPEIIFVNKPGFRKIISGRFQIPDLNNIVSNPPQYYDMTLFDFPIYETNSSKLDYNKSSLNWYISEYNNPIRPPIMSIWTSTYPYLLVPHLEKAKNIIIKYGLAYVEIDFLNTSYSPVRIGLQGSNSSSGITVPEFNSITTNVYYRIFNRASYHVELYKINNVSSTIYDYKIDNIDRTIKGYISTSFNDGYEVLNVSTINYQGYTYVVYDDTYNLYQIAFFNGTLSSGPFFIIPDRITTGYDLSPYRVNYLMYLWDYYYSGYYKSTGSVFLGLINRLYKIYINSKNMNLEGYTISSKYRIYRVSNMTYENAVFSGLKLSNLQGIPGGTKYIMSIEWVKYYDPLKSSPLASITMDMYSNLFSNFKDLLVLSTIDFEKSYITTSMEYKYPTVFNIYDYSGSPLQNVYMEINLVTNNRNYTLYSGSVAFGYINLDLPYSWAYRIKLSYDNNIFGELNVTYSMSLTVSTENITKIYNFTLPITKITVETFKYDGLNYQSLILDKVLLKFEESQLINESAMIELNMSQTVFNATNINIYTFDYLPVGNYTVIGYYNIPNYGLQISERYLLDTSIKRKIAINITLYDMLLNFYSDDYDPVKVYLKYRIGNYAFNGFTDTEGKIELRNIPDEKYLNTSFINLEVYYNVGDSYGWVNTTVNLGLNPRYWSSYSYDNQFSRYIIKLKLAIYDLAIKVLDINGNPVSGAEITLMATVYNGSISNNLTLINKTIAIATSNNNGLTIFNDSFIGFQQIFIYSVKVYFENYGYNITIANTTLLASKDELITIVLPLDNKTIRVSFGDTNTSRYYQQFNVSISGYTTTTNNGQIEVQNILINKTYNITIYVLFNKDTKAWFSFSQTIEINASTKTLIFHVITHNINISIYDENGTPVKGARILIMNEQGKIIFDVFSQEPIYLLSNFPDSKYRGVGKINITIQYTDEFGFQISNSTSIDLATKPPLFNIDMIVPITKLDINVYNHDNILIDAEIEIYKKINNNTAYLGAVAATNGTYSFTYISIGTYKLVIYYTITVGFEKIYIINITNIELLKYRTINVFLPIGNIKLKATAIDGLTPIANATINLFYITNKSKLDIYTLSGLTDINGEIEFQNTILNGALIYINGEYLKIENITVEVNYLSYRIIQIRERANITNTEYYTIKLPLAYLHLKLYYINISNVVFVDGTIEFYINNIIALKTKTTNGNLTLPFVPMNTNLTVIGYYITKNGLISTGEVSGVIREEFNNYWSIKLNIGSTIVKVTDLLGRSLQGVRVYLTGFGGSLMQLTDSNGEAIFLEIPNGNYTLYAVYDTSFGQVKSKEVYLTVSENNIGATIILDIRDFTIVVKHGNSYVENATVELKTSLGVKHYNTDKEGRVYIQSIPVGTYIMTVYYYADDTILASNVTDYALVVPSDLNISEVEIKITLGQLYIEVVSYSKEVYQGENLTVRVKVVDDIGRFVSEANVEIKVGDKTYAGILKENYFEFSIPVSLQHGQYRFTITAKAPLYKEASSYIDITIHASTPRISLNENDPVALESTIGSISIVAGILLGVFAYINIGEKTVEVLFDKFTKILTLAAGAAVFTASVGLLTYFVMETQKVFLTDYNVILGILGISFVLSILLLGLLMQREVLKAFKEEKNQFNKKSFFISTMIIIGGSLAIFGIIFFIVGVKVEWFQEYLIEDVTRIPVVGIYIPSILVTMASYIPTLALLPIWTYKDITSGLEEIRELEARTGDKKYISERENAIITDISEKLKWKLFLFVVLIGYSFVKSIPQLFEDVFFWIIVISPVILLISVIIFSSKDRLMRAIDYLRNTLFK